MANPQKLKYPIGQFQHKGETTPSQIENWIQEIERPPQQLREALQNLSEQQLETPNRPGGWAIVKLGTTLPTDTSTVLFGLSWR